MTVYYNFFDETGTAAILGALNLHCIFAMALMRPPPEFNRIKPKLNLADESKEPLVSTNSLLKIKRLENWNSRRSLKDDLSNSVGAILSLKCLQFLNFFSKLQSKFSCCTQIWLKKYLWVYDEHSMKSFFFSLKIGKISWSAKNNILMNK